METALRDSPALRDQLRVLQSNELARVLAEGRVSERRASASAGAPGLFDRLRDFLRGRGGLVLAPLAAAALLALVFLRSGPSTPVQTAPTPAQEVAKVEPPPAVGPTQPPAVEVKPGTEAPAPVEVAQQPKPRPPAANTATPSPKPKQGEQASTDADYLAMAEPDYRAPLDALTHKSEATYVRGAQGGVHAIALAPPHTGLTTRAAPVLLWYLSKLPAGSAQYELLLANGDGSQVIARRPLQAPLNAGVQLIELSSLGIDLPERRELRWSVVVKLDPENPSSDLVTSGWIERVPESAELRGSASRGEAARSGERVCAAGVWYEAVETLSRVVKRAPGQTQPRKYLERMLERAGLKPSDVTL